MKIISIIEYLNDLDRGLRWGRPGSMWESHYTYGRYYHDAMNIYAGKPVTKRRYPL